MKSVDALFLTFLGNALWQIPALLAAAALGARLLRRGPARYRHALWVGALAAAVLLPAASLLPRREAAGAAPLASAVVTLSGSGAPLGWTSWAPSPEPRPARVPGALAGALVLVYGFSVAIHALRLARAWRWTGRLARSARAVELPERAAPIAARCAQAFGLGPVPVLCSPAVDGPVTLGARQPAILLPPGFLESAPPEHLTAALGHEMAHIRRRDFLLNLLGEVWLLPVAFHPATRWLRRQLAETREMACDEAAVERLIAPRVYVRSLVSLAAVSLAKSNLAGSSRPAYTLGALGADFLEVRMRRLLDAGPRLGTRRARATLGLAALLLTAAGLTAAGFSLEASLEAEAAGSSSRELAPFVGVWKGEANELVIREVNGRPEVALTWFRQRRQEDGTTRVVPMSPQVSDPLITGRTLRFRTRAEIQYRPDSPREKVEFDQVFELLGDSQGKMRQVWSSLEGRQDVPPPPPPTLLKRQS